MTATVRLPLTPVLGASWDAAACVADCFLVVSRSRTRPRSDDHEQRDQCDAATDDRAVVLRCVALAPRGAPVSLVAAAPSMLRPHLWWTPWRESYARHKPPPVTASPIGAVRAGRRGTQSRPRVLPEIAGMVDTSTRSRTRPACTSRVPARTRIGAHVHGFSAPVGVNHCCTPAGVSVHRYQLLVLTPVVPIQRQPVAAVYQATHGRTSMIVGGPTVKFGATR